MRLDARTEGRENFFMVDFQRNATLWTDQLQTEDFNEKDASKLQDSYLPDAAGWPDYDPHTGVLRKSPVNTDQKIKVAKGVYTVFVGVHLRSWCEFALWNEL